MAERIASRLVATSVGTPGASAAPCANDSPTKHLLPIALLLFAAIVPYLNSLPNSFHFDDFPEIVDNEGIRSLHGLWQARPLGRWLTYATYFVNYWLHGLSWLPGWHLVNIFAHAGCVLLLYQLLNGLCQSTLGLRQFDKHNTFRTPAFCAAILFAVHPLASEPVNYLQARCVLLYTFFTLVALYSVVRLHQSRRLWPKLLFAATATLAIGLAAVSKPVGLFFAIALPLLYIFVVWLPASPRKRHLLVSGIGFVSVTGCLAGIWLVRANIWDGILDRFRGDLPQYFFAQWLIFWRYIGLAVLPLPSRLNVDHTVDYRPYTWSDGEVILSMIAVFIVVVMPAACLLRRRPAIGFLFLAVPLGLLPYFFLTSVEAMVEYRFYLPLAFFCGLAGILVSAAMQRIPGRPLMVTFVAILVLLAVGTAMRNTAWRTDLTLWKDAVAKSPRKARTLNALAWALLKDEINGDVERGLDMAKRSLDPRYVDLPPGFNPYMLDTLAEAWFLNGNTAAAVQIEKHLIQQGFGDVDYFERQLQRFSQSKHGQAIDSSSSHR